MEQHYRTLPADSGALLKDRLIRERQQYLFEIQSLHDQLKSIRSSHEDSSMLMASPYQANQDGGQPRPPPLRQSSKSPRRRIFSDKVSFSRELREGINSNQSRPKSRQLVKEVRPFHDIELRESLHRAASSIIYQEPTPAKQEPSHQELMAHICRLECCLKQLCAEKEGLAKDLQQSRSKAQFLIGQLTQQVDTQKAENLLLHEEMSRLRQSHSLLGQANQETIARLNQEILELRKAGERPDGKVQTQLIWLKQRISQLRGRLTGGPAVPVISAAFDQLCTRTSQQDHRFQAQLALLSEALGEERMRRQRLQAQNLKLQAELQGARQSKEQWERLRAEFEQGQRQILQRLQRLE